MQTGLIKICSALAGLVLLAGLASCGGGNGSESVSVPLSVIVPATSDNATVLSAQSNSITISNGDFQIRFGGTADVSISGSNNNVSFALNQSGGAVSVSGDGNTLIFRSGATVSSLTVSGKNNTVYLAEDSPIVVSGTAGSGLTIRRYSL